MNCELCVIRRVTVYLFYKCTYWAHFQYLTLLGTHWCAYFVSFTNFGQLCQGFTGFHLNLTNFSHKKCKLLPFSCSSVISYSKSLVKFHFEILPHVQTLFKVRDQFYFETTSFPVFPGFIPRWICICLKGYRHSRRSTKRWQGWCKGTPNWRCP